MYSVLSVLSASVLICSANSLTSLSSISLIFCKWKWHDFLKAKILATPGDERTTSESPKWFLGRLSSLYPLFSECILSISALFYMFSSLAFINFNTRERIVYIRLRGFCKSIKVTQMKKICFTFLMITGVCCMQIRCSWF